MIPPLGDIDPETRHLNGLTVRDTDWIVRMVKAGYSASQIATVTGFPADAVGRIVTEYRGYLK